jgi:holo-[acyl-carrier protein] synthase
VGVGADLVQVQRLAEALARHPGMVTRLYTDEEIAYCERHREPAARYAARFAAKEAVLKALGTGLARGMRWRDVEVVSGPHERPTVVLRGAVARLAREQGIRDIQLALTHDGAYALACAVTEPLAPTASGSVQEGDTTAAGQPTPGRAEDD